MNRLVQAKVNQDGKGHGKTINSLAIEGKIRPVAIHFSDGRIIECNSVWAATDWLKENGFYEAERRPIKYAIRDIPDMPSIEDEMIARRM